MDKKVQFSASRISELLAGGSGKTRMNYIYELAEKTLGIDTKIQTNAMKHGVNSEIDALNVLIDYLGNGYYNSDGLGGQVYFEINDYVGATPDAIGDDWVGDAKCQYYIHTFFQQNDKLSKKYHDQLQCQMLALNVDKGYLINYLTKPEEWGVDEWKEYPFDLYKRFYVHEIKKCDMTQNDILEYSEKYYPYIGLAVEQMLGAKSLTEEGYFNMQFNEKVRFLDLKNIDWSKNEKTVYRLDNKFYVKK